MPSKRTVQIVLLSETDAEHFMSWMHHYGKLEFENWLEGYDKSSIELETKWDEFKIIAEERDQDIDLIDFDNSK